MANNSLGIVFFLVVTLIFTACGGAPSTPEPADTEDTPSSAPTSATEDSYDQKWLETLISKEEVLEILPSIAPATAQYVDFRERAADVNPEQMMNIDSFLGFTVDAEDGKGGVTLSVIEFKSQEALDEHITNMKAAGNWESTDTELGEDSIQAEGGGVAVVTFWEGELVVQINGSGNAAVLQAIHSLAKIVGSRLQ